MQKNWFAIEVCILQWYNPLWLTGLKVPSNCLQGQGHSKGLYNQNMTVSAIIAGPFATKLGLIIQPKPECPVNTLDCSVQGNWHSQGSKCKWMFVQVISSEPQNIFLPNLVWLCNIMSLSVMLKNLFHGQSEGSYVQNMICWFFANQTWSDHKQECHVKNNPRKKG